MRQQRQISAAMILIALTSLFGNEQAQAAVDSDRPFCELPGGESLHAIYEGDYDKQERMAWDYLMEVRRNDTNDAMMGVFMQNVALGV